MTRAERIEEAARALDAQLDHARRFLWMRESMHRDGIALFDAAVADLRAALAQPATGGDEYRRGVEDAARIVEDEAHYSWHPVVTAQHIRALSPPPDAGRCERCGGSGRNLAHEDGDGWLCPECGGSGSKEGGR